MSDSKVQNFENFIETSNLAQPLPSGVIWVGDYEYRVKNFKKCRSRDQNWQNRENSVFLSLVTDFQGPVWETQWTYYTDFFCYNLPSEHRLLDSR